MGRISTMIIPKEDLNPLEVRFRELCCLLSMRLGSDEYRLTSGKRSPEHNKAVGGVDKSAHVMGIAADVAHDGDIIKAMKLAYWLGRLGFERVGFYDRHIHFDSDKSLPQVQWKGKST